MQFEDFKLKGYKYLKTLGEGGQGKVIKVEDPSGRRIYALKILHSSKEFIIEKEIKVLQKLNHDNIVQIYRSGFNDKRPYILMQYMKHGSIQEYANKNQLEIKEKLVLIKDVADALEYVHEEGFLHRDIKPSNIFITDDGQGNYACLGDFGIAKEIGGETETEGGRGSYMYLPLEVLSAEEKHSMSSDIYGLGMSMYTILVGRHPCETFVDYVQKMSNNIQFKVPSAINSLLNSNIDEVCLRSISTKRKERFRNVSEFSTELKRCIELCSNQKKEEREEIIVMDNSSRKLDKLLLLRESKKDSDEINESAEDLRKKGNAYYLGEGNIKKDYRKARKYYEQSAEKGDLLALVNLAYLYEKGYDVKQNYTMAKKYYKKALILYESEDHSSLKYSDAKRSILEEVYVKDKEKSEVRERKGYTTILNKLGFLYENGYGGEKNYKQARKYYEKAVLFGNTEALIYLGRMYFYGCGIQQNYIIAKEYYEKAVLESNTEGMIELGYLYYLGYGVEQDIEQAIKYYKYAGEKGNVRAFCNLGDLYLHGNGIEENHEKAKKYYEYAAEKGSDGKAEFELGYMYQEGFGIEQNIRKAVEYYKRAAVKKNLEAFQQLGDFYFDGNIVEQDYKKAIKYYEYAVEKGIDGEDEFKLGIIYEYGYGTEQNYERAIEYYERSGEKGNLEAFEHLVDIFENGNGVEKSLEKAEKYSKCLMRSQAEEWYVLGIANEYGYYGVDQNYEQAKEYYEYAISEGHSNALINLAGLYKNGYGVQKDEGIAKKYYLRAVRLGNKNAKKDLKKLENKLRWIDE